ncbi:10 TM acyl transferase domain found in Cas1p-domain-containing protein, partial [Cladochytrium replicatum]
MPSKRAHSPDQPGAPTSWSARILSSIRIFAAIITFWCVGFRFITKTRGSFVDNGDCNDVLSDGSWIDDAWRTHTCSMHAYTASDIALCFAASSRIDFIGDSTVRMLYFALLSRLGAPTQNLTMVERHADRVESVRGLTVTFSWDPYFNRSVVDREGAGATVIGFGLWAMKYGASGGLEEFKEGVGRVGEVCGDGGGKVVVRLVQPLVDALLSEERRERLADWKVNEYNRHLVSEGRRMCGGGLELGVPDHRMYSEARAEMGSTEDGLHYSDNLVQQELDILLNRECNEKLFGRQAMLKATCCVRYKGFSAQVVLSFLVLVTLGPISYACRRYIVPSESVSLDITKLLLVVTYCYICDRTSLFMKLNKHFTWRTFIVLTILSLLIGLLTLQKLPDTTFLNRNITEEWKGWMQVAILIYHFVGASKILPVYICIRAMVASYLFMTGYGQFQSFYQKKDYSFSRMAKTVLRLNLLSLALAYVMETDVLFYYFGPLVTFWFVVIYITMGLFQKWNHHAVFLMAKIASSGCAVSILLHHPEPLVEIFGLLEYVNVHWDAEEFAFRLRLDRWAVYVGMITAWGVIKLSPARKSPRISKPVMIYGQLFLDTVPMYQSTLSDPGIPAPKSGFFSDKKQFNTYVHPYLSPLIAVLYVLIRNATPGVRQYTSWFFRWIGQISLETFVLQFHMWLGQDTTATLAVISGSAFFWANLFLITVVFLYFCEMVAPAVGRSADCIVG